MASPSPSSSPSPPTPPTSTSQTTIPTVPTVPPTPQWQDKKWRAKNAKVTIGRIPKLLKASARAQAGIDRTELIPYTPSLEPGKPIIPTMSTTSSTSPNPKPTHPKITVQKSDTFDAAFQLLASIQSHPSHQSTKQKKSSTSTSTSNNNNNNNNNNKRVAVLNMASALQPGGGVLNGSLAQEESLCSRSTLYYSLLTQSYRLPELSAIYSPDILVFRGSTPFESKILAREEWRFVDVISVAAVKGPDVEVVKVVRDGGRRDGTGDEKGEDGGGKNVERIIYASERDKEAMVLKIRLILQVARLKGITHLVLGAFGCGAYSNPVREVAEIFKRVILGDGKRRGGAGTGIEDIVFAIFDEGENLRVFREVFEPLDLIEDGGTDVGEV